MTSPEPRAAPATPDRAEAAAGLRRRLAELAEQQRALAARIAAVRAALARLEPGAPDVADTAAGTAGDAAAEPGPARGWAALDVARQEAVLAEHEVLARTWARVWADGEPVDSPAAQELARRHRDWLSTALDAPARRADVLAATAVLRADPDAARAYDAHGDGVAAYVRDALTEHAART